LEATKIPTPKQRDLLPDEKAGGDVSRRQRKQRTQRSRGKKKGRGPGNGDIEKRGEGVGKKNQKAEKTKDRTRKQIPRPKKGTQHRGARDANLLKIKKKRPSRRGNAPGAQENLSTIVEWGEKRERKREKQMRGGGPRKVSHEQDGMESKGGAGNSRLWGCWGGGGERTTQGAGKEKGRPLKRRSFMGKRKKQRGEKHNEVGVYAMGEKRKNISIPREGTKNELKTKKKKTVCSACRKAIT